METRRIGFQPDALLAPAQALTLYFSAAQLHAPRSERVALVDAYGRILAQDIRADADYPAFPRSAMDGFAVRSADAAATLRIVGEIAMGRPWQGSLPEGAALRIPTGGVLPPGADAVVPIEDALVEGGTVRFSSALAPGDCVTPAASDMRAGETMLAARRRIGGAELGVLATLGVTRVAVFARPVFGVVSSGDELVPPDRVPVPGEIRDSNRYAVAGVLAALGAAVRHFPIARDEHDALREITQAALAECDGVIVTGGSSVGERDLTPRIIAGLGRPGVIVHGLRVKPGKPTVLAAIDGKPVIGLPGNPTSALTILEAVAAPIIAALTGAATMSAREVEAELGGPIRKRAGWTWYVPVRLDEAVAPAIAYPLELRSSAVGLLARASGFLVLGEGIETLAAGAQVRVRRFSGS
jgi:molybdopterin molybdotransferase